MSEQQTSTEATKAEGTAAQPAATQADGNVTPQDGQTIADAMAGDEGAQQTDSASEGGDQQTEDTSRGAPDSYELARPESLDESYELDSEVMSSFEEAARELDLSNDAAQNVVNKVLPKMIERSVAQHQATVDNWAEQVRTDQEIGGDKPDANLKIARTAIDKPGDQTLRDLLTGPAGLGNHPSVVKFMFKVGQLFSEDRTGLGDRSPSDVAQQGDLSDGAMASLLYPNTPRSS